MAAKFSGTVSPLVGVSKDTHDTTQFTICDSALSGMEVSRPPCVPIATGFSDIGGDGARPMKRLPKFFSGCVQRCSEMDSHVQS